MLSLVHRHRKAPLWTHEKHEEIIKTLLNIFSSAPHESLSHNASHWQLVCVCVFVRICVCICECVCVVPEAYAIKDETFHISNFSAEGTEVLARTAGVTLCLPLLSGVFQHVWRSIRFGQSIIIPYRRVLVWLDSLMFVLCHLFWLHVYWKKEKNEIWVFSFYQQLQQQTINLKAVLLENIEYKMKGIIIQDVKNF